MPYALGHDRHLHIAREIHELIDLGRVTGGEHLRNPLLARYAATDFGDSSPTMAFASMRRLRQKFR